jgi:hypothetical protein
MALDASLIRNAAELLLAVVLAVADTSFTILADAVAVAATVTFDAASRILTADPTTAPTVITVAAAAKIDPSKP